MGCNMRREKSESPEGEEGKGEIKKYIHTYIYRERERKESMLWNGVAAHRCSSFPCLSAAFWMQKVYIYAHTELPVPNRRGA